MSIFIGEYLLPRLAEMRVRRMFGVPPGHPKPLEHPEHELPD